MCLKDLITKHDEIHRQLLLQINFETTRIRSLADAMAECATNMQGQGYGMFITAREEFIKELDKFRDDCSKIVTPHTNIP